MNPRGIATLLLLLAAGLPRPEPLAAQDAAATADRDYGVGIVAFTVSPAPGVEMPAADTLVIHSGPSSRSPVVARFILQMPEPFVWGYALEIAEDGVHGNALEFDYEVLGLPVDSVDTTGEWVRVVYGSAGPSQRHGWVRQAPGRTRLRLWSDVLAEHPLFFRDPAAAGPFHDGPDGARVRVDLEPGRYTGGPAFDYRLEPLEVDGRWMKVRVVTPDDACSAEPVEPRVRTAWIEYLDERRRPRVWYHTRGC